MLLDRKLIRNALVGHVIDQMADKAREDEWRNVLVWNGGFALAHTFQTKSRWWLAARLLQLALTVLTQRSR